MTDQNKNVVNKYFYTPFGLLTNQEENVSQPFKFAGQHGVMYEPNGFYYMRARYYDPSIGRFISEDPSGFDGGDVNLYAYCNDNPINRVDPSGLEGRSSGDSLYAPSWVSRTRADTGNSEPQPGTKEYYQSPQYSQFRYILEQNVYKVSREQTHMPLDPPSGGPPKSPTGWDSWIYLIGRSRGWF